jgi:hypothetical protein
LDAGPKPGIEDHRFSFFRSLVAADDSETGDGVELPLEALCDVLLVFVDEPVVLGVL